MITLGKKISEINYSVNVDLTEKVLIFRKNLERVLNYFVDLTEVLHSKCENHETYSPQRKITETYFKTKVLQMKLLKR